MRLKPYSGRHRRPVRQISMLAAVAVLAATAAVTHHVTVTSGETLYSIGQRYGLSWQKVYAENKHVIGSNPNLIYPGETLTITKDGHGGWKTVTTSHETTSLYANPLRAISGRTVERIDMGADFGGSGPVYAVGSGWIQQLYGGWPGGAYIRERLSQGPLKGKLVYYAEDISPRVHIGEHVTTSTEIGRLSGQMETGWASTTQSTPMSYWVYSEGSSTAYGKNFDDFLHALGLPRGQVNTALLGHVGSGYYHSGMLLAHRIVTRTVTRVRTTRWHRHHSSVSVADGAGLSGPVQHSPSGYLPANWRVMFSFFRAHGYTGDAAAGIEGNMWQESGGNPDSVGDGGCGLIGWTPCSVPVGNLKAQLYAVLRYNAAFGPVSLLNHAGSAVAAAQIYASDFERCGTCVQGNRDAAAQAVARAEGLRR